MLIGLPPAPRQPERVATGRQHGVTLIELIVTLAVFGVLFALATPMLTNWIRNSQVRSVAESVQNGLRAAQQESVRRSRAVVFFQTYATPMVGAPAGWGGRSWVVQYVPAAADTPPTAPEPVVHAGRLNEVGSNRVLVLATNPVGNVAAVCFNSNGRLLTTTPASNGVTNANCNAAVTTFNITHIDGGDRPLRVMVDLGGRVRMCDPNRPAAAPDGC
jgi:type IV fimbrial biogenesis protein FimT